MSMLETLPSWISRAGGYQEPDSSGFLVAPDPARLTSPWKEAAHTLSSLAAENLGVEFVSSFVIGQVSLGLAVPLESELEVYVLTKTPPDILDRSWIAQGEALVASLFDHVSAVRLTLLPREDVVNGCTLVTERFLIKSQSTLLAGEDVRAQMPGYQIDKELGVGLFGGFRKLQETVEKTLEQRDMSELEIQNFSRQLIRAAFGLVMLKEMRLTRDFYWSYQAFAKEYPDKETEARRALELCFLPRISQEEFSVLVREFAAWVAMEFAKLYSVET